MIAPQTGRIFISYRRIDSAGYAGRIYDRLAAHFGKDAIFMDVDTIEAGLDFVDVLENAVQSCDVLVALIGRQWLNITDEVGKRRLDNPEDFVRVEVTAALKRGIRVIPVLFDGVPMPNSNQLPRGLKTLSRRNAVLVNHHSFHTDATHLIEQLELALKAAEDTKTLRAEELKEKEAQKKHQAEIGNLLSQANIALDLEDLELAKEKLDALLILEPEHVQAQIKLAIVERKLQKIIELSFSEEKTKREIAEKAAKEKAAKDKAEREAAEKVARKRLEQAPKYGEDQAAIKPFANFVNCPNCGEYNQRSRIICSVCGHKLEQETMKSEPKQKKEPEKRKKNKSVRVSSKPSDNTLESHRNAKSQGSSFITCSKCNEENSVRDLHCYNCGAKL